MSQPDEHGLLAGQARPPRKVGYCSPPEEHRFKGGVSGNPKGRPKKKPAEAEEPPFELYDIITKELGRRIKVTESGKPRRMSVLQAMMRNACNKGLQGDLKAFSLLLHQVRLMEQDRRRARRRSFDRQVDYKRRTSETIRKEESWGNQPPNPVPHPDDMQIDSKRERVIINGPADDVEKAEWDRSEALRKEATTALAQLKNASATPARKLKNLSQAQKTLEKLVQEATEKLESVDANYPSAQQRRQPGFDLERWRKEKEKGSGLN